MPSPTQLLARLDAIGAALAASGRALALIGLGSSGAETDRLDRYSDLDFFAIVEPGARESYLSDLAWCGAAHPLAYAFRNTPDGYKLLFADGIFCEFAVFEPQALAAAQFAAPRLVWCRDDFDPALATAPAAPVRDPQPTEWLLGEALTNLFVGLGRERRGERLSATRFIQSYALDRLLELAPRVEAERAASRDPFSPERRVEARLPDLAARLPELAQGYGRNVESALAILAYLEQHFAVDPAIAAAIRALVAEQ